jgi:hypothetical protein
MSFYKAQSIGEQKNTFLNVEQKVQWQFINVSNLKLSALIDGAEFI